MSAYESFLRFRWPPNGDPICPRCDGAEIYIYKSRRIFKCRACNAQFSSTTGTMFSGRKLSFPQIIEVLERKQESMLQFSKRIGVQYRTSWERCGQIRKLKRTRDTDNA